MAWWCRSHSPIFHLIVLSLAAVVVEGCMKSIRRYTKLMEQRIDWGEVLESEDADEGERVRVSECMVDESGYMSG